MAFPIFDGPLKKSRSQEIMSQGTVATEGTLDLILASCFLS